MIIIIIWAILIMSLSILIMSLTSILASKTIYDQEKNSPFECGFDPMSSARMPFSLHFFLISIIFLIFDIEIALLLPMIITFSTSNSTYWFLTMLFFINILLMGLYYEWMMGMLKWT